MQVLPCGIHAVLVELEDGTERADLVRRLEHHPLPGVAEIVPAAQTVLLVLEPGADRRAVAQCITDLPEAPADDSAPDHVVTIEVTYDGPDLADVATHLSISTDEVVRRHTSQTWTCEFVGFLPGFGYLDGEDESLTVPRKDTPRDRVPTGSVALAAGWSAVYPSSSPGGWQLIGRSSDSMFDIDRDPPGLVRAGTRVRFREAR